MFVDHNIAQYKPIGMDDLNTNYQEMQQPTCDVLKQSTQGQSATSAVHQLPPNAGHYTGYSPPPASIQHPSNNVS